MVEHKRRASVMLVEPREAARLLLDDPGTWYVVAMGPLRQRHVMAQSALRLRSGDYAGFQRVVAATGAVGRWEATVRREPGTDPEDAAAVKMYARWVP